MIVSKAELNMRMISADSFETMTPRALSQRTGTVTLPVACGSEARYTSRSSFFPSTRSPVEPAASVPKLHPSGPSQGWTTSTLTCGARPLSSRKISVRCAQGQASAT